MDDIERPDWARWIDMRKVVDGPLPAIAARLSAFFGTRSHDALVIFTRECTGRPRKVAGKKEIVDRVTIDELEEIKQSLEPGTNCETEAVLAGSSHRIWAVRDPSDILLVMVPKASRTDTVRLDEIAAVFGIVAMAIHHQVAQASPDYLAESRAASSERARTIAELTGVHEATLSTILGTLRSRDLDDRRARITASETASAALTALRSTSAVDRELSEEAVTTAFARLQGELGPMLKFQEVEVEYAAPPADGRPLPGEVAFAARAMVRAVVLALCAQPELDRLRIAWDCDGENVLLEIRDNGPGWIDTNTLRLQLAGRLRTLRGDLDIESIPGWGHCVKLTLPLDPPAARPGEHLLASLNPREMEVLGHLAEGKRNRVIAEELGVTQSTIKFHVASVLKKLEVANRGEAAAVAIRAGVVSAVPTPAGELTADGQPAPDLRIRRPTRPRTP
ncbi:MAG TPA: LuxR C-terminal-related transcriptional regulator [Flexivirga sp.]|uniref:LuxR C-terminal-related transcriptional regulator n=1 Tax=Flexivirga sp. TaxID=1962927 RepID=UPI002CC8649C|nr:LuxR C-terminal-related transcriptional regulator [Flexivirga sp.]HWC23005.1 LuxR C-terminal-related transcriptional regulator [Flexivirga sp.]